MNIYSHPTKWALVDDQENFLRDLEALIPDYRPYATFIDPIEAIDVINASFAKAQKATRKILEHTGTEDEELSYSLRTENIELKILNQSRINEYSVVIADYLMPTLDGLELFDRLEDSSIKKVLLTGVADKDIAVQAFNEGRIDTYVPKNDLDAIAKVWRYSAALERNRFSELQAGLTTALLSAGSFIKSETVLEEIQTDMTQKEIIEYYYLQSPPGFLALDLAGNAFRYVVFQNKEIADSITYAANAGAPANILDKLSSREFLGYFYEQARNFEASEYNWSDYLSKATRVDNTYWLAIFPAPPLDVDYQPSRDSIRTIYDSR